MKPHEEAWTATASGCVFDERGYFVANGVDRARLIASAPDMARALMAFVSGMDGNSQGEDLENARLLADDALRKAGVLP